MESAFGSMPWVKKIYQFSDEKTKKNLKLAHSVFWKEHAKEKFLYNFAPGQESRHSDLYCYDPCPKVDEYEVSPFD